MSKAPWRPGTAPANLDDVRHVFRRLNELDARPSRIEGEFARIAAHIERDRKHLAAIVSNLNALIRMTAPTPAEREGGQRRSD